MSLEQLNLVFYQTSYGRLETFFFLNETYATCPTRNSTDSRQTRSMRQTPVYRHLICQSKSVLLNRVVNKLRTRLEDSSKLMTLVSETRVWCFLDRFCVQ